MKDATLKCALVGKKIRREAKSMIKISDLNVSLLDRSQ
jgi:hypothetical protein